MTKLTVAEASKRGYATGLSILQAVQKEWLRAEKGADGQLVVETAELERLFGRPAGSSAATIPFETRSEPIGDAAERLEIDDDREDDFDDDDDDGDFDDSDEDAIDSANTGESRTSPGGPATAAMPDSGAGGEDSTAAPVTVRSETPPSANRDALLAEIAELRDALAAEQRRVTALLDVLATRVLPPAAPVPDVDEAAGLAETSIVANDDVETAAPSSPAGNSSEPVDAEPAAATFGQASAPIDDSESAEHEAPDIAVPPVAGHAVPRLAAEPDARRTEPASATYRKRDQDSGRDRALFWQVWVLVSLVWVVLIGAFLWYLGGLGDDLWVVAEWLRGERSARTPEFAEAAGASLRAARDIFAPPAALLALMLVVRGAFRKLRRR